MLPATTVQECIQNTVQPALTVELGNGLDPRPTGGGITKAGEQDPPQRRQARCQADFFFEPSTSYSSGPWCSIHPRRPPSAVTSNGSGKAFWRSGRSR